MSGVSSSVVLALRSLGEAVEVWGIEPQSESVDERESTTRSER